MTKMKSALVACAAIALSFGAVTAPASAQGMVMTHRAMMHHRMMHHDRMMMHHDRMMMRHDRMMMRHHMMHKMM